MVQTGLDKGALEGWEPEFGTPRLQRRDDLAGIVADETEARIPRVFLNHCSTLQHALSTGSHSYQQIRKALPEACANRCHTTACNGSC